MLHRVEITGFDRSVQVQDLVQLVRKTPLPLEFGVVMQSSKIHQRPPRRPPFFRPRNPDWAQLVEAHRAGLPLACHASGSKLIEQILRGESPDLKHPLRLEPFQTLQLNTTSRALPFKSTVGKTLRSYTSYARFVEDLLEHDELRIEEALHRMPARIELVIQVLLVPGQNGQEVPEALRRLAQRIIDAGRTARLLLDTSGGRGQSGFERWPPKRTLGPAFSRIPVGYTGGLNPENIEDALRRIATLLPKGEQTWCGMESGARSHIPHPAQPDRTISVFDLKATQRFLKTITRVNSDLSAHAPADAARSRSSHR